MAGKVSQQQKNFELFDQVYRNPHLLKGWDSKKLEEYVLWLNQNRNQPRIVNHLQTVMAYFPIARIKGDTTYPETFRREIVGDTLSREEIAFNSLMDNPEVLGELDSTYVHGLALWVIAQGNQIEEERYQGFFAHVSAEKLSPDQRDEITKKRVERDFPDVKKPDTFNKAARLAKACFFDAIPDPVFAGKQRVLALLTEDNNDVFEKRRQNLTLEFYASEIMELAFEVMVQLRMFQRDYYQNGYLGKREVRDLTPQLEGDDLSHFGTGSLRLRLHRIWERPLVGIEWSEEACQMLTEGEVKEIVEKNPSDALVLRVMAKASWDTIDWSKVSVVQRKQIREVSFKGKVLHTEFCKKFAVGLKAEEVVAIFGNGLSSATLLKQLELSQEGIEWKKEAHSALEGRALVEMVKTGFSIAEQQNFRLSERLKALSDEHQADLFVFYQGDVPGIEWRLNLKLTFEMKQKCAEYYGRWEDFPTSLREAFHPIALEYAFDFVIERQWGDAAQLAGLKWGNASDEQRRKGSYQSLKIDKTAPLSPYAEGLDSEGILRVWRFTRTAAMIHKEMGYSLEGIEWGAGVGPHLEGKVLAEWLNNYRDNDQLERLLASEDKHVSLLNEVRKKEAIELYIKKGWKNPPECLRMLCTREEHHKLFGLTFGDKVGIFFVGLLTLLGLSYLYKRRKKG